jgi:nucleotide-binding universal stress UspA family protein
LPLTLVYVATGDAKTSGADSFLNHAEAIGLQMGVKLQADVRHGKAFTEILAAAAACQADLLVIGSRSDSHIGRAVIGGVAQKVIGLSDKPVLALNFI